MKRLAETYKKTQRAAPTYLAQICSVLLASLVPWFSLAETHPGYIQDVSQERATNYQPLNVVLKPKEEKKHLREVLFNRSISQQIYNKYVTEFGRNDLSSNEYNQAGYYYEMSQEASLKDQNQNFSDQEKKRRQKFGTFIARTVAEYHVGNFFTNEPRVGSSWQLAEQANNMQIELAENVTLSGDYVFGSNELHISLRQPQIEIKFISQMNPDSLFSSAAQNIYQATYFRSDEQTFETKYFVKDKVVSVNFIRKWLNGLSLVFSVGSFDYAKGEALSETLYLQTLRWNY